MNNIITSIAQRIRDEHRKHPDIDWEYIAASKIYQSFIDTGISDDTEEFYIEDYKHLSNGELSDETMSETLNKMFSDTQQHENTSVLLNQRYIFTEDIDVWGKKGMEVVFSKTHDEDSDNWYKVYYYGGLPFKIMEKKVYRWIKNGYLKLASNQYDFSEIDSVENIEHKYDKAQPLEEVVIKLNTEYVCVVNTDYFHTDEIIMFDDNSQFHWTLRLIYNTGFSMDIPKETVERMIRTGEIVEHKDTLSDTTNKNDNTVSDIVFNY